MLLVVVAPVVGAVEYAPWPDGAFNPYERAPIRVFIDKSNLTVDTAPYADEVRAAWAWWEGGGNGALSWRPAFEEAAERGTAEILVWFEESDRVYCANQTIGLGCGAWGSPETGPGIVKLAIVSHDNPSAGTREHVAFDVMRSVAMHELGHALGLPHSATPGDIMHPGWDGFVSDGENPEGLLRRAEVRKLLGWLGVGLGALGLVWVTRYAYHRVLDARGRLRVRRIEAEVASRVTPRAPATAARVAPVVKPGGYVRNAPCPVAPDGRHAFEVRTVNAGGQVETWHVCRLCRHPQRL